MNLLTVNEAWQRILQKAVPLSATVCALEEAAGRILAEAAYARIDLPPFDNSAMDGYALRAADTQTARAAESVRLRVVGEVAAGQYQAQLLEPGTAVKIMTGAPLPPGADSVLMLEAGRLREDVVEVREPVPVGKHVRRQGEDVRHEAMLLPAGVRLNAQRLGLLAGSGIAQVRVVRQPIVHVMATGSELVAAGHPLGPGQIYDSNRVVLKRLLERIGIAGVDLGVVPDDPGAIAERVRRGLEADILLISGGVSVGAHDYVKTILRELGVETVFWRVNMKPGKPIFCGWREGRWVFGLPGNPISCVVGFLVFVEPLIRRLEGESCEGPRYECARLGQAVRKSDPRAHFLTAHVERSSDGGWVATPTEQQGSAMMQALAYADAFVVMPAERDCVEAGEHVEILPIHE